MNYTTRLRTLAVVPTSVVATTTIALNALLEAGYVVAAYELVELARDPKYQLFGNTGDVLTRFGLLANGQLHDTVRDIILASFDGNDLNLTLVNPVVAEIITGSNGI